MTTTCVVGLGKIGLPLAVQIASKGVNVVGADISASVVSQTNAGQVPFPGEADLEKRLRTVTSQGLLSATLDTMKAVNHSDTVVVAVPLVVQPDGRPDYRAIDQATTQIGRGLRAGTLVSYETTLPVGTTRQRFSPRLAELSNLVPGRDLFICHSPERVLTGRIFADLRRYPKLVGGIDAESTRRAVEFYEMVLEFDHRPDLPTPNGVWVLDSVEAAELAKLAETTYRDVNIALANEFARYADTTGIDVYEVIEAANSQPYSHIHNPGIAVGGHCIPVYPHFYLASDLQAKLPAAARRINDAMPGYAVARLQEAVGDLDGLDVSVLGASYRGGVKEVAFSGVFPLVKQLRHLGANVKVHDPMFSTDELVALGFRSYELGQRCRAAIIQADHAEYGNLTPEDLPGVKVLFDGRRITSPDAWAGVTRIVVGGGSR